MPVPGYLVSDAVAQPEFLASSYLDILKRRIEELRGYTQVDSSREVSLAELETLHLRIHNLVGSGAIFGHAQVGDAAQRLDNVLSGCVVPPQPQELADLIRPLIEACEQAMLAREGAHMPFAAPIRSVADEIHQARRTLLIIDDDPAIHDLIGAMLGEDAKVISAYGSEEAIALAQMHAPDLILLDHYLPGINGIALLDRMREDERTVAIPVMMLTAEKQPYAKARAEESGIVDYICKPFDPLACAEKIRSFLGRYPLTVLIASENAVERQRLSIKLRQQGLEALEADNGAKTVQIAEQNMPDLIILDECMRGANGETLHRLSDNVHTRPIPVLHLIVNRRSGKTWGDLKLNVIDHVVTPFVPEEIVSHTLEVLGITI